MILNKKMYLMILFLVLFFYQLNAKQNIKIEKPIDFYGTWKIVDYDFDLSGYSAFSSEEAEQLKGKTFVFKKECFKTYEDTVYYPIYKIEKVILKEDFKDGFPKKVMKQVHKNTSKKQIKIKILNFPYYYILYINKSNMVMYHDALFFILRKIKK